jgi:hypothetical protein
MKARAFLCTFAAAGFLLLAANAQAATITVTGTGDTIAVDGVVTLREAITSANTNASVNADVSAQSPGAYGNDTINFNIAGAGVHTISLTAALPSITGPITINGYSPHRSPTSVIMFAPTRLTSAPLNTMPQFL